jgi:hypothetical protein
MPEFTERQTIELKVMDDIARGMREAVWRMEPFMSEALAIHKQMEQITAPMVASMDILNAAVSPLLDEISRSQESFAKIAEWAMEKPISIEKSFVVAAAHKYPSVDEVANAVIKKLGTNSAEKSVATTERVVFFPEGATWERTDLRFKDSHTLSVFYNRKSFGDYDCATLGLAKKNTRDKKPDKQWQFLQHLSIFSQYEAMSSFVPSPEGLAGPLNTTAGGCEKIKEKLSQKLKIAFGISDEPFYGYEKKSGYRTKFSLSPEPDMRTLGELHSSGGKLFERNAKEDIARDLDME